MTQSPERTNGQRGMLLGRLRTAGARDFITGARDLATLVTGARDLVTGTRDLIAVTRDLATVTWDLVPADAKNGHRPPRAGARNGYERPPAGAEHGHRPPPAGAEQEQADVPVYAEEWWRSALVPAGLLAGAFLVYGLPRYATLDPSKSRVPLSPTARWHYPALVAHIAFGTVAIATTPPQLWTWLRVKHPRLHRRIGKAYVYGGVVPSAVLGLAVTPFAGGPVGDALEALGWLYTTFRAQQLARQHDFAGHRRWMLYSYALCSQVIWGRILIFALDKTAPQWLKDNRGLVLETASWIGSAINLIAAQWWYERTLDRPIAGVTTQASAARQSG